jgi:hypothetical protein
MSFSMTVEAGCILENIHTAAQAEDCLFSRQLDAQAVLHRYEIIIFGIVDEMGGVAQRRARVRPRQA